MTRRGAGASTSQDCQEAGTVDGSGGCQDEGWGRSVLSPTSFITALKNPPSPVGPVRRAQQSSEEMFHLQRTTRQSITDGKKEKSSFRMWISRYQDIVDILIDI